MNKEKIGYSQINNEFFVKNLVNIESQKGNKCKRTELCIEKSRGFET